MKAGLDFVFQASNAKMRQACYYVKCVKFCTWVVLGRSGDCQAPYRFGKIAQLRVSTPGWILLGERVEVEMSFRIPFGSWIMNQAVANMLKPAWQSSSSHVWGAGATRGHLITSKRVLGCHDKPWSKAADIWSHAFLGPTPEKLRMIQDWEKPS